MRRSRSLAFIVLSMAGASLALAQPAADASAKAPAAKVNKVYDEAADARQEIAAAMVRAKRDNKRVLIQWGGNWCSWCLLLNSLCQRDPKISHELLYEYEVVHADAGRDNKNMDLGRQYQAKLEEGFPYLTILDAAGTPIANQETGSLEVKDANGESVLGAGAGHDPAKVLKFLTDHQAPAQDANAVLAAGLGEARAGHKRVFLHFGAPWCGWCRKLEGWMQRDDVAPLLSKEFVDVKIDIDRMTGGQDVFAKFNPASKSSGIPWFAFLDADGKRLADSMVTEGGTGQNIGFPAADNEIAHFGSMLTRSATHLSTEEIAKLTGTLRAKPGAGGDH